MKIRKILATVVAIMLIAGVVLPISASANTELTFVVGANVPAPQGGTVTVPINVRNNPGFAAVGFRVEFNPDHLWITNVTPQRAELPLNPAFFTPPSAAAQGSQWISLINPNEPADWNGDGALVLLEFQVRPGAPPVGETTRVDLFFTTNPSGIPADEDGNIYPQGLGSGHSAIIHGGVQIVASTSPPQPPPPPPPPGAGEYRVTFNPGGGVWASGGGLEQNIAGGSAVTNPPVVTRAGHTFTSWSSSVAGMTLGNITGTVTFTAQWTPVGGGGNGGTGNGGSGPSGPQAPEGTRYVILNAGTGANWGTTAPSGWVREPAGTGNITAIRSANPVEIGVAMPTFSIPTNTPANQSFSAWQPVRPATMPEGAGNWSSTAQWTPAGGGGTNGGGGGTGNGGGGTGTGGGAGAGGGANLPPGTAATPDNHPGLRAPGANETRPTGAGTITVQEHFSPPSWTGTGPRTARVDADHTTFTRLWLGNFVVVDSARTIASGSTVITLTESFISGLADGTHVFLAEFSGGHATPINLVVSRGFGTVPQTGVPTMTGAAMLMWSSIAMTVTLGIALYIHVRKTRRDSIFDN